MADIFCLGISRNWIENLQESTGKPAVAQNFLLQVSTGGRRLPADDGSGRVLGPWQRRGMQDRRYDSFESRFSTVRSSSFGLRDLIIKPAFLICSKVSKVIFSPSWSRERERHQDFPRLSLLGGKPPRPTTPSSPFFSCRASWQRHTPLRNAMGIWGSFCKV